MRSLVLDVGNTAVKAGFFDEAGRLLVVERAATLPELVPAIRQFAPARTLLASVGPAAAELAALLMQPAHTLVLLAPGLPLPIGLAYATPATLGADRLAAAAGAAGLFPAEAVLILDAGTCLKADLLTPEPTFRGGAISPGLAMRFAALAQFTQRLPLLNALPTAELPPWPGDSTAASIRAGVELGFVSEAKGFWHYAAAQWPGVRLILTGGDANWLAGRLGGSPGRNFTVEPNLVLLGLYQILLHNT